MKYLMFIGAILFIIVAHLIRVRRLALFIKIYESPNYKNLILALATGYFLNYIVPYKLGDLARAWIAGSKMKNGKALGFSTVIIDRYLDIIVVGIIFSLLNLGGIGGRKSGAMAVFYIFLAFICLGLLAVMISFRDWVKKAVRHIAGIFNATLEMAILQFVWALIWNFKDMFQRINKFKILVYTIGMWASYLTSYFLFAAFFNSMGERTTWADIFSILFAQNGIFESTGAATLIRDNIIALHPLYAIAYMAFPIAALFLISTLSPAPSQVEKHLNLLPQLDPKERLDFLENYFSNTNRDYIITYFKINQDVSIIRDYSAGSNATTMLCMDGERTFFRKYAFGDDGNKLYQQVEWLNDNRKHLPLPSVLDYKKTELYCYYDMPYVSNSVGLFEFIHSMPIRQGWEMIQKVLKTLERSIYKINVRPADPETIQKYIEMKVAANLASLKKAKAIKSLQQYEHIIINGVRYRNLPFYEKYLSSAYLQKVFGEDVYATIHGDLTIENIICIRDECGKDGFYIIDPNTGNIHDSPNLDYGKLLQSIHGGYEFLMSTKEVSVCGNKINFPFTRPSAYAELHQLLKDYLMSNLGAKQTKSIYFHEIVHWIRLLPYKVAKDGKRALLFYAGMLMVMHDIIEMYGGEEI